MNKIDEKVEELKQALGEIEMDVLTKGYSLSDAIREGAMVSKQASGQFGNGEIACTLTSAYLALRARGLVDQ